MGIHDLMEKCIQYLTVQNNSKCCSTHNIYLKTVISLNYDTDHIKVPLLVFRLLITLFLVYSFVVALRKRIH